MEVNVKNPSIQDIKFDELENISAITCLVGLSFPDSANEFQRSALCLAHVMASVREAVLKGYEVPHYLVVLVTNLSSLMLSHSNEQK